jgi:hypothetical protein
LAVVTAQDDVMRLIRQDEAGEAGHGKRALSEAPA